MQTVYFCFCVYDLFTRVTLLEVVLEHVLYDVLSRGEGKPPTIGMSETNQHIEAEEYICVCLPAIDLNVRGCKC